jgi:hypothetical protein
VSKKETPLRLLIPSAIYKKRGLNKEQNQDSSSALKSSTGSVMRFPAIRSVSTDFSQVSSFWAARVRALSGATVSYLLSASIPYPITASANRDLVPKLVILIKFTPAE